MKRQWTRVLIAALAAAFLFEADPVALFHGKIATSDAVARVGRPATPGSVAGVARRTTRRTIRRGAYIAALPAGCARVNTYGYSVYLCGGVYYQSSGGGFVVVTFH